MLLNFLYELQSTNLIMDKDTLACEESNIFAQFHHGLVQLTTPNIKM